MVDHHMILDTLPTISRLFFMGRVPQVRVSYLQLAIFLAVGLQHKDVDAVSAELDLPSNQVLAFFNKTIRKIVSHLRGLVEAQVAKELPSDAALRNMTYRADGMHALKDTLKMDQQSDERLFAVQQRQAEQGGSGSNLGLKKSNLIPSSVSLPKAVSVTTESVGGDAAHRHGAGGSGGSGKTNKHQKKHKKREGEGGGDHKHKKSKSD